MSITKPAVALVHVGKTGGTFLKDVIRSNSNVRTGEIVEGPSTVFILPGHLSYRELEKKYESNLQFFFVFREPCARFISGFYSRLRMGRPVRNVNWSVHEAAAFSYFSSANDLAEALSSDDERWRSAAIYSFDAIRHLKRGYCYHFGTKIDFTLNSSKQLLACTDIANLDRNLVKFLTKIGIENAKPPVQTNKPRGQMYDKKLSLLAENNLREFWKDEFEFYNIFKKMEENFF